MRLVAATTPSPVASGPATTTRAPIDPNRVTPGMWGFLSFVVLLLAAVVIFYSMRKQLKKVNFDDGSPEAGSRSVDVFPIRSGSSDSDSRS